MTDNNSFKAKAKLLGRIQRSGMEHEKLETFPNALLELIADQLEGREYAPAKPKPVATEQQIFGDTESEAAEPSAKRPKREKSKEKQDMAAALTGLGKCPCCEDGVVLMDRKIVRGAKMRVYSCSNTKIATEDDGETWERVGSCNYTIWGDALKRYGGSISPNNIKELLSEGQFVAELKSKSGKAYEKYVVADEEYGVSVLWDIDVEDEE